MEQQIHELRERAGEAVGGATNLRELDDVRAVLERQIEMNTAISREGMRRDWGANIGKVLLSTGDDIRTRAKAAAAKAAAAETKSEQEQ